MTIASASTRQTQHFTTLQAAQELSGLDTSDGRERWGANFTVKPHQRLAGAPPHSSQRMSDMTYASMAERIPRGRRDTSWMRRHQGDDVRGTGHAPTLLRAGNALKDDEGRSWLTLRTVAKQCAVNAR